MGKCAGSWLVLLAVAVSSSLSGCIDAAATLCGNRWCPSSASCVADAAGAMQCVPTPVCGNGAITNDEQCDGANMGGASCEILGYYGGSLSCDTACKFDVRECQTFGWCGDGQLQLADGEQCEGADSAMQIDQRLSCTDFATYDAGDLQCDPMTCRVVANQCQRYDWQILESKDDFDARFGDAAAVDHVWAAGEFVTVSSAAARTVAIWRNGELLELPMRNQGELFSLATGETDDDGRVTAIWVFSGQRSLRLDLTDLATTHWIEESPVGGWAPSPQFPIDAWARDGQLYVSIMFADSVWRHDQTGWHETSPEVDQPLRFMPAVDAPHLRWGQGDNCRSSVTTFDHTVWSLDAINSGDGDCRNAIDRNGGLWVSEQGVLRYPAQHGVGPYTMRFARAGDELIGFGQTRRSGDLLSAFMVTNHDQPIFFEAPTGTAMGSGSPSQLAIVGAQGIFTLAAGSWSPANYLARPNVSGAGRLGLNADGYVFVDAEARFEPAYEEAVTTPGLQTNEVRQSIVRATDQLVLHNDGSLEPIDQPVAPMNRLWASVLNPNAVVAVGNRVMAIARAGTPLHFTEAAAPANFTELEGNHSDDLYALADHDMWHYDGAAWRRVLQAPAPLLRVWVSPSNIVWAISSDTIFRYNPGDGSVATTSFPHADFAAISGSGDDDIFVGGRASNSATFGIAFSGLVRFHHGRWSEINLRSGLETVRDLKRVGSVLYVIAYARNESQSWVMTSLYLR
ncbi:MAG TPA: hypothetical protein PLF40_04735 [Kofleriaceae bacterium]|nr:hypothetical protein [Kofleriaceae bacterium]